MVPLAALELFEHGDAIDMTIGSSIRSHPGVRSRIDVARQRLRRKRAIDAALRR